MTVSMAAQRALSKVAAVALLIAVVWLVVAFVVLPLTTRLADAREQIEQERQLLGGLLEEARALTSQPVGGASLEAEMPSLLSVGSDAATLAELQARVEGAAADAGVRVTRFQPMGEQTQGSLRIVSIRASAGGSIDQLQAFVHNLEAGKPALFITSMDVAPQSQELEAHGRLDMRLSIAGALPVAVGERP